MCGCKSKITGTGMKSFGTIPITFGTMAAGFAGGFASNVMNGFVKEADFIQKETDAEKRKQAAMMVEGGKLAVGLGAAYYFKNPYVKIGGLAFAFTSGVNLASLYSPAVTGQLAGVEGVGSSEGRWTGYNEAVGSYGREGTKHSAAVGNTPG